MQGWSWRRHGPKENQKLDKERDGGGGGGGGGGEGKLELQRKLPKSGWGVRRALEEA